MMISGTRWFGVLLFLLICQTALCQRVATATMTIRAVVLDPGEARILQPAVSETEILDALMEVLTEENHRIIASIADLLRHESALDPVKNRTRSSVLRNFDGNDYMALVSHHCNRTIVVREKNPDETRLRNKPYDELKPYYHHREVLEQHTIRLEYP